MSRNRLSFRVGDALFRAALITLPPSFRAAYGREILDFHRTRIGESGVSALSRLGLWLLAIGDVVKGALMERSKEFRTAIGGGQKAPGGLSVPSKSVIGPDGGRKSGPQGPGMWLDFLQQDLRFAFRSLARTRGFTFVAVFSLAIGIGLFTGVFSFLNNSWFQPVPGVTRADRVVEFVLRMPGTEWEVWSYPDFLDVREAETPFEELAGWRSGSGTLTVGEGGEPVRLMSVSANYFRVLGAVPARGRDFLPAVDRGPGQHPVMVVSHEMWVNRLGMDPEILGRTLVLNQTPYTVVGVAPEGFSGHRILTAPTEIWIPLMQDPVATAENPMTADRDAHWLRVLGTLRDGATLSEGNAALETVFTRLEELYPDSNEGLRGVALTFGSIPALNRNQAILSFVLVATLLSIVLLIICGNVAGMVLARSVTREPEIAIRLALGSGRGRLARLLLMEALLLAAGGGVAGILLGVWGMDLVYATILGAPSLGSGSIGPVLLFTLATTLVTAVMVGLLPAIRFSRPDLVSSLKEGTGGSGRRAGRIHKIAASAQTGVALLLLVTCSLFVRGLGVLERKDLGFEPIGVLTTSMDISQIGIESSEVASVFMAEVREVAEAIAGVASVTIADGMPVDLVGNFTGVSRLDQDPEAGGRVQVEFTQVTEGFFETIGATLLQGRGIEVTDDPTSESVMVITESLANRLWPGEDALGRRVSSGVGRTGPEEFTVVGVVADVASSRSAEDWPNIFVALRQHFRPRIMVILKGPDDPSSLIRPFQAALLDLDSRLPFPVIVSADSRVVRSGDSQRNAARMAGGLGVFALLLSAIGVYGVVAFTVSRRTREIGLRMAMGSSKGKILTEVLRDAVRLAIPGLIVGAILGGVTAVLFRSEFLGLSPIDPISYIGGAAVLFLVVLLASIFPARKASGIDPMSALRQE